VTGLAHVPDTDVRGKLRHPFGGRCRPPVRDAASAAATLAAPPFPGTGSLAPARLRGADVAG